MGELCPAPFERARPFTIAGRLMTRTLTIVGIGVALWTSSAQPAHAQMKWTDKVFLNVNFGAQAPSQSLSAETTPEIYGETAIVRSSQDVGGGAFFDISGGYKLWRNLTVGVGYTRVASKEDLIVDAQIPDSLVFDSPRAVTTTFADAQHTQQAINLTGTWMMPVTDKIDVGFQFGPTIFLVSQDLPLDLTQSNIQEPSPTIVNVNLSSKDKTTVGVHFGVDVTYLVTPRYGVGVLARYAWGSADLGDSSESVTVGGFQIGGGLRVRF
jgi:hypothetical protein